MANASEPVGKPTIVLCLMCLEPGDDVRNEAGDIDWSA